MIGATPGSTVTTISLLLTRGLLLITKDMAPDKIYIHLTPHLGLLEATAIPVNAPDEQEYIRKDALLEWLEKKVPLSYGLATDAFIEIIDKLNSL